MKYLISVLTCFLIVGISSAQEIKAHKKALKIVDVEVTKVDRKGLYPRSSAPDGAVIDTSLTRVGETVGVSLNNEYIAFENFLNVPTWDNNTGDYVKNEFVTVVEYEEFIQYVRDSMARERLYFGLEEDEDASRFLDYHDKTPGELECDFVAFDESERSLNLELFNLNWDKGFYYDDPWYVPILADMYISRKQRINRRRRFDDRILSYQFTGTRANSETQVFSEFKMNDSTGRLDTVFYKTTKVEFGEPLLKKSNYRVPVLVDDVAWAENAKHNFDEYAVLSQVYRTTSKNAPIVGLTGIQARAYCQWKQDQLQKQFDKKKLDLKVQVSLPIAQDMAAPELEIPCFVRDSVSRPVRWKITREDYQQFYEFAKDSMLRDYLHYYLEEDEDALMFLMFHDYYFSEGDLEYVDYEESDRDMNRILFPLDKDTKIDMDEQGVAYLVGEFEKNLKRQPVSFKYEYVDAMQKSVVGPLAAIDVKGATSGVYQSTVMTCTDKETGATWNCYGKSLDLDKVIDMEQSSGVRCHKNYAPFNVEETVVVYPLTAVTEENAQDDVSSSIEYAQALAFYHWKFPIQDATEESYIWKYVFPSREQFEQLQRGEQVLLQFKELEMASPAFRYVIHLSSKN